MSMFEISRAQGAGASEAVEPGMSVVVSSGDRIHCDQSFTEVSSITRIDNNLQLIVADNPPIVFNQFFSAPNSLIQFTDQQFTNDALNKMLSVHLTSTDSNQTSHEIFLSLGSAVLAQPGDNYYLNAKEFDVKDLHRHGEDLMIQSHDETAKTIAVLKGFFSKPEAGFELPQLHITDPAAGETQDMIVHPHSNIFQWEGEPLPIAVIGSLYGYYFNLQGADADKFVLVAKSADGELPPWMSFAHVGEGKYYLAGVPTPGSVGSTEIVINAYSIQNKIGFHTTQSFQLQIKSVDDTVTRPTIDDIATAEYRSLSETVTADSFVTSVIAIDQMAYMSMPEIAVITGLAAVNPMTFAQTFSNYSTPEQIQAAKELSDQSKLSANQAIHTEDLVNHVVISLHPEGEVPSGAHGLTPVQIAPEATTTTTSTNTTAEPTGTTPTNGTTPGTSSQPTTEPTPSITDTSSSNSVGTEMTPEMLILPPTNSSASNHALLTILTTPSIPPPPPPPIFITLQSYLDGVHGVTLDGDIFFSFYPGTLGTSAFIIPNATGNGYGALVDASTTGRLGGASLGDVYYLNGQATFPTEFHISDAGVTGTVFYPPFGQVLYPTQIYNASDFNGDGSTDMFFVAYSSGGFTSYIVFGTPTGFPSTANLGNLVSSGGAEAITSSQSFTNGGVLGDVNGSGLSSVGLVESFGGTSTTAYVVFGSSTPPSSLDVSALNGVNGFTITAAGRFAIGQSNTIMGIDLNGDGFNDILFKTYHNVTTDTATIVFGNSTGFPSTFDIGNVGQVGQPAGFVIYNSTDSPSSSHHFADPAVNIGNFNGSGIDSLVINELDLFTSNSSTYVVFGSHSFTNNVNFDLSTVNGSNGFELTSSAPQHYVTSIAYLGDVNGDGLPDFGFIDKSAYGGLGAAYIIFGSTNPFPAVIDYSHLTPNEGLVIQFTPGVSATTIGGGGDLNGDGIADIVLSNPTTNVGPAPAYGASGVSYIVFGSNFNGVITLKGTAGSETLTGTNGNDVIYGGGGNDIINALGGNDFIDAPGNSRIYAGQGNDTIVYYRDDAPVSGGAGTDTLWFKYDNTHVTFIGATNYTGIDVINLTSMQSMVGNSVTLDAATVLSMSDANLMTITGNAHDILTLIATNIWTATSPISGYTTYTSMSGSVVNVQNEVHVTFAPSIAPVALNFTLSSLTDGVHGFSLTATSTLYASNSTIIQNGDGFGDLLVATDFSSSRTSPYTHAFLIDGQAAFHTNVPFNDTSVGLTVFNNDTANTPINVFGSQVISTSDFNGDGINDFLISSIYGYPSILVLGQPGGFPANVPLSTIGSAGVTIFTSGGGYTDTAAALGDVNGDGLADFIISNSRGDFSAVIFGTTTPGTSIDYSGLNGTNGFVIDRPNNYLSINVQDVGGGDITGDGLNDIFVSFWDTTAQVGGVGVILGNSPIFSATVDVGLTGITGANGFIITNSSTSSGSNDILVNPTNIGDFTGSGIDSIALSSKDAVFVIFGSPALSSVTTFDLASLNGTNGFTLVGAGGDQIHNIAYLGDVNGDGLPDFGFTDSSAYGGLGAVYVIFGSQTAFPATINFTNLNSSQGFVITDPSINLSYAAVSGGGDLNGDGLGDIVITSQGNEYIVFGNNFNGAITQMGTANQAVIQGVGSNDVIYAGTADHTIIGGVGTTFIDSGTGHDVIIGGPGINTIVYSGLDTQVFGG